MPRDEVTSLRELPAKWRTSAAALDATERRSLQAMARAECYRSCADQLEAALPTPHAEGWVLVPRVPTLEMIDAGFAAIDKQYASEPLDDAVAKTGAVYHAMLAAIPAVSVGDAKDGARLDFVQRNRVGLTPEYEGQWDAEVYGEEGHVVAAYAGATPRDAIDAAMRAQESA